MMERSPNFIYWQGGDNTRLAGKMQLHNRLAFDGEGLPMFQVFSTCRNCIRTLTALVYDRSRPEDIDTQGGGSHLRHDPLCAHGAAHRASAPGAGGAAPGGPPGPLQGSAVFTNLTHKEA